MDQLLTQLMAGGILAIIIIDKVLNFLKAAKNTKNDQQLAQQPGHEDCVQRIEFDKHKEAVRYADTCDKVHEGIQRQFNHFNESLARIETLIRNGHGK